MGKTVLSRARFSVQKEQIADFCKRWGVVEFALFGSALRDDFRPDSDVDVLVTFAPDHVASLDDWLRMQNELKALFGRQVDLVSRNSIERSLNWYRKRIILESSEVLYAA
jgi:predicted nucleotidyltransferase